jgi:uncharacterized membrane protein (UPF0127 family)
MSRYVRIQNATRGTNIAERCRVASSLVDRTIGLLGTPEVRPGEGLLLERTRSIHMFFMRYPIDVVFVDRSGRVTRTISRLGRWRIAWAPRATRDCVELGSGALDGTGTQPGDQLTFQKVE